ncbi:MAG TPA: alpha/beta hydrolase domain-containing protein, partial [Myxococcaceae bacterium]|nr:alpha/beta hydrolase domain-containing protein [Myxococcaceae bacterium]
NSGVIDDLIPAVLSVHRILVPKVDKFGNDVAGIRNPLVEAPIATLTGWNTRTPEFSAGHLCDLNGMTVPLFRTNMESREAGDPRPSLEEMYGDHEGYVKEIAGAAVALQKDRLMLDEDVIRFIFEAAEREVLK